MADSVVIGLALIEIGVGIASALVAAIAWRYRMKRVGRPIIVMAAATSLYAVANALQSFLVDPLWWRLVNNSTYPLGAVLAVSSLFVVIEFTERESLQRPVVLAVCVCFVLLDFAFSMTDPLHNMVITSQRLVDGVVVSTAGPLFFFHTVVSLSIVAFAVGLLVVEFPTTRGIYRRQTAAVIAAFVVGMSGFAWQSFAPVHPAIDVATIGMLGWCGLILWGVFTADFLDIVPIGRHRVVRNIQDPVVTLDGANRVVDSNPAARRLADIDGDWEGTPVESFFASHPDLVSAIEAAESHDVSLDVDGEIRHVTLSVSPIHHGGTGDGAPAGCTVVMRDVTELVGQRREIEVARNRYRSLFENTPLVVWEADLSEVIEQARKIATETDDFVGYLEANPDEHQQLIETIDVIDVNENAVEAYAASSKNELINHFDELLTEESMATNRRLLKRLVDGGRQFREETSYRQLDSEIRQELVDVFVPETHADDCSRVILAGTDITEQKERERELQYQTALFEAMNESTNAGVIVTTFDREILWHNGRFREIWEIPAEILEASDFEAAIECLSNVIEDPEVFIEATERVSEPPYEPQQLEFRLSDGRWVDMYTTPIIDDEGTKYGLLTLTREITDRKQYQTRIETQNQWLERLAQVISHDLWTPLTTADNHLRLLEMELDDPDEAVAQSLADLERTHDRLRKLTEHLPRLARESTDVEAPVECELAAVADNAWEVVDTGSLELVVENSGTLRADPRRLQQVFENLFSNSAEHGSTGSPAEPDDVSEHATGGASTVWVGTHDDGFYVADDGPGISPEQGNEIFKYGRSTGEGSGVGLAIVRNIVEAHGWEISVGDREGGGARFTVDTTGEFAADSYGGSDN